MDSADGPTYWVSRALPLPPLDVSQPERPHESVDREEAICLKWWRLAKERIYRGFIGFIAVDPIDLHVQDLKDDWGSLSGEGATFRSNKLSI